MLLTMSQLPQRSVRSLSLVSTTLYAALFSRLHRAITFRARNEWALNILDFSLFLGDCPDSRVGDILHDTRRLTVKAPIRIARFHRCVYNSNFFPPAMSPRGLTLGSPHEPTWQRREMLRSGGLVMMMGPLQNRTWANGPCLR